MRITGIWTSVIRYADYRRVCCSEMTRFAKIIVLWFAGAIAITLPLYRANLPHYERLKDGVHTKGTITALEPGNHQAVRYAFRVSGKVYTGVGRAGFGNPEFSDLSVGQAVIVYYKPDKPSESCIGIPRELIENEITPVLLAGVTFPAIMLAGWSFRSPRFKHWLLN